MVERDLLAEARVRAIGFWLEVPGVLMLLALGAAVVLGGTIHDGVSTAISCAILAALLAVGLFLRRFVPFARWLAIVVLAGTGAVSVALLRAATPPRRPVEWLWAGCGWAAASLLLLGALCLGTPRAARTFGEAYRAAVREHPSPRPRTHRSLALWLPLVPFCVAMAPVWWGILRGLAAAIVYACFAPSC